MQIGAVSGYSFNPYIYNTNRVSSASMNKIQGIGDDLLSSKTDFSALTEQDTTNPLRKGETLDFAGIISMQLQMSRMNEARVMKTPADEQATQAAGIEATQAAGIEAVDAGGTSEVTSLPAVGATSDTSATVNPYDYAKAMAAYQPIDLYA